MLPERELLDRLHSDGFSEVPGQLVLDRDLIEEVPEPSAAVSGRARAIPMGLARGALLAGRHPGQNLRDEGTHKVDMAESDLWKKAADRAIKHLASTGRLFSAEHVREMVGDPVHPNAFGSRFLAAAKAGLIEGVGYVQSTRPTLHAHPIRLWRGAQQGGC